MKVNYSGAPLKREWQYACPNCGMLTVLIHAASDDMDGHKCPHCKGPIHRHITEPPLMDADCHEAGKTHNIGWGA